LLGKSGYLLDICNLVIEKPIECRYLPDLSKKLKLKIAFIKARKYKLTIIPFKIRLFGTLII